jgi:hypothetical protein
VQVKVDVATRSFLNALVWEKHKPVICKSGFVEKSSINKIPLSELSENSFFLPIIILGSDLVDPKSGNVGHEFCEDLSSSIISVVAGKVFAI